MSNPAHNDRLFHLVFQDIYHHSDHDIIVLAKDQNHAKEKCRHHLNHKGIKHETLQILTEADFQKTFSKTNPYYIFFQNGVGKKFCRIFSENKKDAEKKFHERIMGHAELIRVMNQAEFANRKESDHAKKEKPERKEYSLPPITFTPYFPKEAVNQ